MGTSSEKVRFRAGQGKADLLGGGYRYSLTKDVGLDLGLHYHGVGAPWNWYDKYLVSKIGLDVMF